MALTIVLLVVIFICLAMMWNEGLWSNALSVVNVTIAAMLASNYFEPLAAWIETWGEWFASCTYLWDYLSLWIIFTISFSILRLVTDRLSRYRVRFKMPVEQVGRLVLAAWAGWVIICFACFTLHTAPLARTPFRGSFQSQPKSNNFLGMAPGRMWLGFLQSRSQTALSQADPSASSPYPEDRGKRVFDPRSEFILKYGARRNRLQENMSRTGTVRVRRR